MLILLNVLLTYSKLYCLSILRLPTNMKKTHFAASLSAALITLLALGASSCATKEDLLNVNDKLERLDLRVGRLEQMCKQMNENITALQTLVNAINKRDAITDITPLKQGDASGYTITFLSGKTITVYHGKDGADGKDGHSPVIGLEEMDGNYYWTIDGEPLMAGNDFIKANGVDAIAPQLKIQNGRWLLSTDGGSTWKDVGQATGDPGKDAVEYFQNVDSTSDPDYVIFVLADGTTLRIPKANDIITFPGLDDLLLGPNGTFTFNYQVRSDKAIVAVTAKSFDDDPTIANVEIVSGDDKAQGQIIITTAEHVNPPTTYIILKALKENGKVIEQVASVPVGEDFIVKDEWAYDYYGTANCILIKPNESTGTMNVMPHTTSLNDFAYHNLPSNAPKAAKAKWIWWEITLTLTEPQVNGNTLSVTRVDGYGNALVGIFSEDDKFLWSFHVWCPRIDPTSEDLLKTYNTEANGSGKEYKLMPLALGARLDAPMNENGRDLSIETAGLYYQWGRKDPLGTIDNNNLGHNVRAWMGFSDDPLVTKHCWRCKAVSTNEIPGICPKVTKNDYFFAFDNEENLGFKNWRYSPPIKDTDPDSLSFYIKKHVDWLRNNPTQFIQGIYYDYDEVAKTSSGIWAKEYYPSLWGNKPDENFIKTINDPCPEGYCVAPADVWKAVDSKNTQIINRNAVIPEHNDYYCLQGEKELATYHVEIMGFINTSDQQTIGFYGNEDNHGPIFCGRTGNSCTAVRCVKI